ncbi:hypothetical protein [Chelativorans alearense]|uniref:hypothetical protein n=1 Tax=Chelativorans alearense TaxID=2681495 RepID=UPI0013CFBAD1|nr:hypothetical protein [Chelativorans alearense]
MSAAVTTTDHDEIRNWAEARGGRPARVKATKPDGILRIDFGEPEEELEPITWADFFRIFDESNLAFLYQERTDDDRISRFNKLVERG